MSLLSRSWPTILKYVFGPLILLILFWTIGISAIWNLLTTVNLGYFLLAYFLFAFSMFIAAFNLYLLLWPIKRINPRKFLQYFFANRITALIFPGRLGEFSITYYFHRENISYGQGLAAVVTDKLTTVSCSMIFGIAAIYIFMQGAHISTLAMYIFFMLFIFILLVSPASRKFIRKHILGKYAHHFQGFSATLFSYEREHKRMAILNIIITLVRILVIALSAKAMFLALRTDVPLFTLILIGGLETLSNSIPLTINGLGIEQAIGIYVFSAVGVNPVVTGARYVMSFVIKYSFGFFSTFFISSDLLHTTTDKPLAKESKEL